MIRKEDNRLLGTIAKPHGTKGSLLLRLRNTKPEDIKKRDSAFVEIDGLLVPFFLEEFKILSADSVVVKFEDVDSALKAREFTGCEVYLSPQQLRRDKSTSTDIPTVAGYRVNDKNLGFVGTAGDITGISTNPLLEVRYEGKTYLVPVHESIITFIDDKRKEINIDAPEGLFDI